jgi:hypothetical protein
MHQAPLPTRGLSSLKLPKELSFDLIKEFPSKIGSI